MIDVMYNTDPMAPKGVENDFWGAFETTLVKGPRLVYFTHKHTAEFWAW